LTDPGVYGTFAAYSFNDDWGRKEGATRIALLTNTTIPTHPTC